MFNIFKRKTPKLANDLAWLGRTALEIAQERQLNDAKILIDTLRGQIKLLEAKITLITRLNEINSEKRKSKKLLIGRDLKTGKFVKLNTK